MEARIASMHSATRDPSVALMKYNKLRSRNPNGMVFAFEGAEDPVFYSSAVERCGLNYQFHILVVDGKDMVLGLRALLKSSTEAKFGDGVAFFIDADFDGTKGHPHGLDLYVTPCYSIENLIANKSTLKRLLELDFKLYEDALHDDMAKVMELFETVAKEYENALRETNQLIHFGRTVSSSICNAKITSIEETSTKFFRFHTEDFKITSTHQGEDLKKLVKFDSSFDISNITHSESEFNKLSPLIDWRGKFLLAVYCQFIQILVEDRNSSTPKVFSKGKGKVKLNLSSTSPFRVLGPICHLPNCLTNFLTSLPDNAMRH